MSERQIEKDVTLLLKAKGWEVYHAECVAVGFPDVLAMKDGQIILVEIKALGGDYRPAQVKWHREHENMGNVFKLEEVHDGFRLWSLGTHLTFEHLADAVGWMV